MVVDYQGCPANSTSRKDLLHWNRREIAVRNNTAASRGVSKVPELLSYEAPGQGPPGKQLRVVLIEILVEVDVVSQVILCLCLASVTERPKF